MIMAKIAIGHKLKYISKEGDQKWPPYQCFKMTVTDTWIRAHTDGCNLILP